MPTTAVAAAAEGLPTFPDKSLPIVLAMLLLIVLKSTLETETPTNYLFFGQERPCQDINEEWELPSRLLAFSLHEKKSRISVAGPREYYSSFDNFCAELLFDYSQRVPITFRKVAD